MAERFKKNFAREASSNKNLSWRDFKQQKKDKHRKWKEKQLLEKMKALQESKAQESEIKAIESLQTISIAVPGSILDNAQTSHLRAYLAGQIARAAVIFNVAEIVVFDETGVANTMVLDNQDSSNQDLQMHTKYRGCVQMIRILQYLECPQYLRKYFFPLHRDLEYAGVINPLCIPHHLLADEVSEYREGVVLEETPRKGKESYVYIGLNKTAYIDKVLEANTRVTVKLDLEQLSSKHFKGKAVSPTLPYREQKIYWGYNVRFAKNFKSIFSNSPYKGGYDLTVGTSDTGQNVDECQLPPFKHLLVVFGGLKGLESCFEADESLGASEPSQFFNYYLNTCPSQGSRSIRTEEAILITMAALRPKFVNVSQPSCV